MDYLNPQIPVIPNPINLDAAIADLQALLGQLPWLERVYGRATTGITRTFMGGKEYRYPEVYAGKGAYMLLEPNNYLSAHAFFRVEGSQQPVDWKPFIKNSYRQTISIIIWANLDKVKNRDATMNFNHRYTEELKNAILRKLEKQSMFFVGRIYEAPGDVFNGYTYNHADNQTFKHPEYGLRIEGSLTYDETC